MVGISVSPDSFKIALGGNQSVEDTLSISNIGTTYLEFSLTNNETWLTIGAYNDSIAPIEIEDIELVFSSEDLTQGVYIDTITITSNDPTNPLLHVPCELEVGSTDISEDENGTNLPLKFSLYDNYPNPFNP